MSKMSILAKGTVLAILIALVLSSFPTAGVFAGGNTKNLEDKWDQLVTNFNKQSITHNGAHRWVEKWLKTEKKPLLLKKLKSGNISPYATLL